MDATGLQRFYLLEKDDSNFSKSLLDAYESELISAGYTVIHTSSSKETAQKVVAFSYAIKNNLCIEMVSRMTFDHFNQAFRKSANLSVKDIYQRMLYEIPCKSLQRDRIELVSKAYHTPSALHSACEEAGDAGFLKHLQTETQKVGPVFSSAVYKTFY
jgi:hypothetical protein